MKKIALVLALFFIACSSDHVQKSMVTIESKYSVQKTADRFEKALKENDITIFAKINHTKNAASVGMKIRPTILFIFGNPKLGTPLMKCSQSTAIDLPQKMLIWKDSDYTVKISYNRPPYLKKRHQIQNCKQMLQTMDKVLSKLASKAAGLSNN